MTFAKTYDNFVCKPGKETPKAGLGFLDAAPEPKKGGLGFVSHRAAPSPKLVFKQAKSDF